MKQILAFQFPIVLGVLAVSSASAQMPENHVCQRDPAHAHHRMLPSQLTFGNYGCMASAYVMALRMSGVQVTAAQYNAWLGQNGGYTSAGLLVHGVADKFDGPAGVIYRGVGSLGSTAAIKAELDAGRVIVAYSRRFSGGHWTLIWGYTGTGTTWGDFRYADPWDTSWQDRRVGDGWVQPGHTVRFLGMPPRTGPYAVTVDNGFPGYRDWCLRYPFVTKNGYGLNGNMRATRNNDGHGLDAVAEWRPVLQYDGTYRVEVFIPRNFATTRSGRYELWLDGAHIGTAIVNQMAYSDQWVTIVTRHLPKGNRFLVRLLDLTGEPYNSVWIGADALRATLLHS